MIQYLNVFLRYLSVPVRYGVYPRQLAPLRLRPIHLARVFQPDAGQTRHGVVVKLVPHRHSGDLFRAPVWHVNAALDVCLVPADCGKTADGDDCWRTLWRAHTGGGAGLLVRRLTNPRIRATSSTADILILCVLLIQCILGLTTIPFSAQHPDGSEMLKLVGWAQSVVTFQGGASAHLDGVAWIFRVHLVLGMTIFLLFPFTRLVHVWSAPFEYFTRRYQIVRSRR